MSVSETGGEAMCLDLLVLISEGLREPSTEGEERIELPRSPWSYLPVAYGFVALPLLVAVEYLWLGLLFGGDVEWDPLVLVVWAAPVGLAFWYVAGLPWSAIAGCAGSALGALALVVAIFIASSIADPDGRPGAVLLVLIPAAILGIVAYPFGALARWLARRIPRLGAIWGGSLLALASLGLLIACVPDTLPSDEVAALVVGLVVLFAPASLFAGMATLLVSVTAAKHRREWVQ